LNNLIVSTNNTFRIIIKKPKITLSFKWINDFVKKKIVHMYFLFIDLIILFCYNIPMIWTTYIVKNLVLHFQGFWSRKIVISESKNVLVHWFAILQQSPVPCIEVLYRMRFHAAPWETVRRYIYDGNLGAAEVNVATASHANSRRFYVRRYSYYIYFTFFFLFCGKWKRHELYSRRWYDWLEYIQLASIYYLAG